MEFPGTKYHRLTSAEEESAADDDGAAFLEGIARVPNNHGNRWSHVQDLDNFFLSVYQFWNVKGFFCFLLEEVLGLVQFAFVIFLAIFVLTGVNYSQLVASSPTRIRLDELLEKYLHEHGNGTRLNTTVTRESDGKYITFSNGKRADLWDVISFKDFAEGRSPWIWYFVLACALVFWLHRALRVLFRVRQMWGIRSFYRDALQLDTSQLENYTWPEVLDRVMKAQQEHHMCVHKARLSELDIHNRILRFKNFTIALVNKKVLPIEFDVPLLGKRTFFTEELKYIYEMALFWGPGSPFRDNSTLSKSFRSAKPQALAYRMERTFMWYAVTTLVLSPLIFIWQLFYTTFMLVELSQRKEGVFGLRKWSPYSRQKLRLFNELDHQFNLRLAKAYAPASKYLQSFLSPSLTIVARNIMFFCAAILSVLLFFTLIDEDLLVANNIPLTIASLGIVIGICRALAPEEGDIIDPEDLMEQVVINTVDGPVSDWQGRAHTVDVHKAFCNLFQYRLNFWLEQLLSPVLTPYVLYFHARPRSLQIVNFFRHFTVSVDGAGDVCSFAQLDVRRHGNPKWTLPSAPSSHRRDPSGGSGGGDSGGGLALGGDAGDVGASVLADDGLLCDSSENGKVEMSLINFTLSNPGWTPPSKSVHFMQSLMESAGEDALQASEPNALSGGHPSQQLQSDVHTGGDLYPQVSALPGQSLYPNLAGHTTTAASTHGSAANAMHAFQSLAMVTSLRANSAEEEEELHAQPELTSAWAPHSRPALHSQHPRSHDDRIRYGVGHAALYLQGHVARRLLEHNGMNVPVQQQLLAMRMNSSRPFVSPLYTPIPRTPLLGQDQCSQAEMLQEQHSSALPAEHHEHRERTTTTSET